MAKSETVTFWGSGIVNPGTFPGSASGVIFEFFRVTTHSDGTALVRSTAHASYDVTDGDCKYISTIIGAQYTPNADPGDDVFCAVTTTTADVGQAGNAVVGHLLVYGLAS